MSRTEASAEIAPASSVELEAAAAAFAAEAGAELERRFGGSMAVRFKSSRGRDPVTEADTAIEVLLRKRVADRFPRHAFLGEEGVAAAPAGTGAGAGAAEEAYLWVVDPLDGTANFANGMPIFAVSIAVLRDGRPEVAALYTTFGPDGERCVLHARRGGGLKRDGAPLQRSAAAARGRLVGVPAGFHARMRRRFLRRAVPGETRSLGSIAVELGLAASGRLAFAYFGGPKIWDVAAGVLLVEEAGGTVTVTSAGRWRRFSSFATAGRPLREWRGSVLAGDRGAVREVLQSTRVRPNPLERIEGALGAATADRTDRWLHSAARRAERLPAVARLVAGWLGSLKGSRN